ncbi:MAG: transporter [Pseudomonadota bacterium]|nr:transporter [Pseudomonadota bacterium]
MSDPRERLAAAFSYSIKLPSASEDKMLGAGRVDHNLRFILDRTFDKTNYRINASYLNVGREDSDKRADGAQIILTVIQELPKNFGLIAEVYGQSVDEAQPRGVYALGALTYKINSRLHIDAGLRAGSGSAAPDIGVFTGLTIGVADFYR